MIYVTLYFRLMSKNIWIKRIKWGVNSAPLCSGSNVLSRSGSEKSSVPAEMPMKTAKGPCRSVAALTL